RQEGREAEVYAHVRTGVRQRTGGDVLAREGDEPVTAPVALERDGLHAPLDRSGQEQLHAADAAQREVPPVELPAGLPEGDGVEAVATLEPREAGPLAV